MPLILAIEPDRRQTSRLAILARNQLRAELLLVDTVEQALAALEECDPDLILTSPLLPSRDQYALAMKLRELAEDGLRVQTVTIPVFGAPGQRARAAQKGAPAVRNARARTTPADGIDPVVFGMQLSALIDRSAAERAAAPQVPVRRLFSPRAIPARIEEPVAVEAGTVDSSAHGAADPDDADWADVLSAIEKEIENARHEPYSLSPEIESDEIDSLASALVRDLTEPPIPAATPASAESLRPRAAASGHVEVAPSPAAAPAPQLETPAPTPLDPVGAPASSANAAAAPRTKRIRRVPPQDEFGFFDPRQCGFSALFAKLNAKDENGGKTPKKPA
jgi:hypothetical protein